ncbi:MAG: 16S rRNA (adenine(1518)-N(6)/adenine(1519)-N(6))-dimethyltransferase RsmA [Candidatus Doudnabacteria bacterium]|nr:16S rRNA (adenine(1518)-N(6)/adenine(1519)-N(6))-dimethyltransferase RsmA [Candidatus Doudnabacteria bacterium]
MNILTDPEHLKNLMHSLHLKPKDYMGQNFLISQDVINEIITAAEIRPTDTIVEIGPGLGVLTQVLVEKAKKVIAIEKDKTFIPVLKNYFKSDPRLEIIESDVLKFNFESLPKSYKIVSNIPYYLTSHLLQNLLALKNKPSRIVLMVQKEVGERLTASPGALSILGISVQILADVEIATNVLKQNFWPKPKVDSAIVVITPKNKFPEIRDEKLFFRILKIAFAGKRKQLHNTLQNGLKLSKASVEKLLGEAGVPTSARPQELTIPQWISIYNLISRSQG